MKLVNELKDINDKMENGEKIIDHTIKCHWIGVCLTLIDESIKHVSAKFRLRGLGNFSSYFISF